MDQTLSGLQFSGLAGMAWAWTTAFAPRLFAAVLMLVVGLTLAGWLSGTIGRIANKTHVVDATVRPFIVAAVRYGITVLVLILVLGQLGIETTSLLAVLGAAGLAVGLALQGTLSNIASGIMLLWLRPFQVGDYIEVNNMAGIVETTGLFSCELRTYDGARLFAPNSTIWNFALRNHSRAGSRLIALNITLGADASSDAIATALDNAFKQDDRILENPAPTVFVDSFNASGVVLTCRIWTKTQAYNEVQRNLVTFLMRHLQTTDTPATGIQLINRFVPAQADTSRLVDYR